MGSWEGGSSCVASSVTRAGKLALTAVLMYTIDFVWLAHSVLKIF